MSQATENKRNTYTANGSTDTFPYTFEIYDDAEIVVYADDAVVPSDQYTVSGVGTEGGGNVVFDTAPAADTAIVLLLDPPLTQEYDPDIAGPLAAETLERQFDRAVNLVKMLSERLNRVPMLPPSIAGPTAMATIADQAGKLVRVNDDEDGFDFVDVSEVDDAAVTFPLSLANGGTAAATAAAARANLEAQPAKQGTDVASAGTLNLGEGGYFVVTGAVTITAISTKSAGTLVVLRFSGASKLTHGASLILMGATDWTPAAGDVILLVSEGAGTWREIWRRPTTNATSSFFMRGDGVMGSPSTIPPMGGQLFGLTLSNNASDPTNDIDVAIGQATSDDTLVANKVLMDLTGALTKRLDATWAVGTNQGMLASGAAITDTTYHIFLIQRPDTGVEDIAADTSVTGANIAANTNVAYTKKRRIGSIVRSGGAIILFKQDGDFFQFLDPAVVSATNPGTSAVTRTLTQVPTGLNLRAVVNVAVGLHAASAVRAYLSDLDINDEAASPSAAPLATAGSGAQDQLGHGQAVIRTNTSAQIRSRIDNSDATTALRIAPLGYYDNRGRTA